MVVNEKDILDLYYLDIFEYDMDNQELYHSETLDELMEKINERIRYNNKNCPSDLMIPIIKWPAKELETIKVGDIVELGEYAYSPTISYARFVKLEINDMDPIFVWVGQANESNT